MVCSSIRHGREFRRLGNKHNFCVPLQIFYSLSERHTHLNFRPCDVTHRGLPKILLDALVLVTNHAVHLPHLHREQAWQLDTALLMVGLSQIQGFICTRSKMQSIGHLLVDLNLVLCRRCSIVL